MGTYDGARQWGALILVLLLGPARRSVWCSLILPSRPWLRS